MNGRPVMSQSDGGGVVELNVGDRLGIEDSRVKALGKGRCELEVTIN